MLIQTAHLFKPLMEYFALNEVFGNVTVENGLGGKILVTLKTSFKKSGYS